jgi:hypothetical protein
LSGKSWILKPGCYPRGLASSEAHDAKRADLQQKLGGATCETMKQLIGVHLKVKMVLDKSIDVFASERQKATSKIMVAYDAEHEGEVEAMLILHDPLQTIWKRLAKKVDIQNALDVVAKNGGAAAKADSSQGVVAQTAQTAQGAPQSHVPLMQHWVAVLKAEMDTDDVAACHKKLLISAAQTAISDLARTCNEKSGNLCVSMKKEESSKHGHDDKVQVQISRRQYPDASAEPVKLDYVGKVVDALIGKMLPRATTLPLKIDEQDGPELFLDGRHYMNTMRSDMCFAWLIPPMPSPAKAKATTTPIEEAEQEEPEMKKVKKTSIEGAKYVVTATHQISWVRLKSKLFRPKVTRLSTVIADQSSSTPATLKAHRF